MSRALIVVVDDDEAMLESVAGALRDDYAVRAFSAPAPALDELEQLVPDAIVSDIVMPTMGGFEFRRLYAKRFADRRTPFLFLSSLGDAETMVAGLEAGADDFVVKPIVAELLRARIKALLRRRGPAKEAMFRGELSRVPFTGILQFCEAKRFTGELAVESDGLRVTLPVRGGELDPDAASQWIDRLWELGEGSFTLRATTPDFSGLVAVPRPSEGLPTGPCGRLSTVLVRGRRLNIETEYVGGDAPAVVSLVLAGSDPVAKFRKRVPTDADAAALQSLIDAHHAEAEAATHDRVSALRHQWQHGAAPAGARALEGLGEPQPEAAPDVGALFDEGFERSRKGDWAGALACWERALAVDPTNRTLSINVEVARKKLAGSA